MSNIQLSACTNGLLAVFYSTFIYSPPITAIATISSIHLPKSTQLLTYIPTTTAPEYEYSGTKQNQTKQHNHTALLYTLYHSHNTLFCLCEQCSILIITFTTCIGNIFVLDRAMALMKEAPRTRPFPRQNAASLLQSASPAIGRFPLSQTINVHASTHPPRPPLFSFSFTACLITNALSDSCTAHPIH